MIYYYDHQVINITAMSSSTSIFWYFKRSRCKKDTSYSNVIKKTSLLNLSIRKSTITLRISQLWINLNNFNRNRHCVYRIRFLIKKIVLRRNNNDIHLSELNIFINTLLSKGTRNMLHRTIAPPSKLYNINVCRVRAESTLKVNNIHLCVPNTFFRWLLLSHL